MDQLPLELIEKILSYSVISVEDVINFSSTCQRFRSSVLNSSVIWKQKYLDKWPKLLDLFDHNYKNFLDEIQYIYEMKRRTFTVLESMPPRFFKKYQLSDSDMEEWEELVNDKEETYYYLISHLMDIIAVNEHINSIEVIPLNTPGNKTLQYYAREALRFIKQHQLAKEWREFLRLPRKKQLLEKAATFVAQWCQPDLDLEELIDVELDKITDMVKDRIYEVNPNHQIFQTSVEVSKRWKTENLDKNQWSSAECRDVIAAMRNVVYNDLGYSGNRENYYLSENSLINKVMEYRMGLPIILAIIYEGIGRRLGLFFEPINFPAHFLLRFTDDEGKRPSVYYIDTFNDGTIIQKTLCPYRPLVPREELFPVATAPQVVERIINNLELSTRQHIEPNGRVTFLRSILELQLLINPEDLQTVTNLAKLYIVHDVNTRKLEGYLMTLPLDPNYSPVQIENTIALIQECCSRCDNLDFQKEVVQRTDNVKYAVGIVVTDITTEDKCVIHAWDPVFTLRADSPTTTRCTNVMVKHKQHKLPFYNVLVEDGSYRYVSQELLLPTSDIGKLLRNKDLGRHFSHFFVNHFVPNAEKEKEYPGDKRVRQQYYYDAQLRNYQF